MTARHPMDCYLTPPEVGHALGDWLFERFHGIGADHFLDPFAGAGTLVPWTFFLPRGVVMPTHHAYELDMRWDAEQRAYVHAINRRMGRDSLAMEWLVRGSIAPHVVTNIPFGVTEKALARCRDHAYERNVTASVLMRTDWWQHQGRSSLRPDHMLLLEWRPAFGFRWDKQASRLVLSTDYAGYVICVYEPCPTHHTEVHFLARPEVPIELRVEHKRLARLAYHMGHEAQGATP